MPRLAQGVASRGKSRVSASRRAAAAANSRARSASTAAAKAACSASPGARSGSEAGGAVTHPAQARARAVSTAQATPRRLPPVVGPPSGGLLRLGAAPLRVRLKADLQRDAAIGVLAQGFGNTVDFL